MTKYPMKSVISFGFFVSLVANAGVTEPNRGYWFYQGTNPGSCQMTFVEDVLQSNAEQGRIVHECPTIGGVTWMVNRRASRAAIRTYLNDSDLMKAGVTGSMNALIPGDYRDEHSLVIGDRTVPLNLSLLLPPLNRAKDIYWVSSPSWYGATVAPAMRFNVSSITVQVGGRTYDEQGEETSYYEAKLLVKVDAKKKEACVVAGYRTRARDGVTPPGLVDANLVALAEIRLTTLREDVFAGRLSCGDANHRDIEQGLLRGALH